jgi:hypothetical protein
MFSATFVGTVVSGFHEAAGKDLILRPVRDFTLNPIFFQPLSVLAQRILVFPNEAIWRNLRQPLSLIADRYSIPECFTTDLCHCMQKQLRRSSNLFFGAKASNTEYDGFMYFQALFFGLSISTDI